MARTKRELGFKNKIIVKAAQLIIERGVTNTSLADIAKSLNISPGTLFYYFPSKGDLIFEISQRHIKRMSDKIMHWVSIIATVKDPVSILESVMRLFLTNERAAGEIHLFLIHEALTGNHIIRERFRIAYRRWSEQMSDGAQQVLGSSAESKLVAKIIIALLDGFLMQQLLETEVPSYREVSQFLLNNESDPL